MAWIRSQGGARQLAGLGLLVLVVVALVVLLSGGSPTVGYDVSYPQCPHGEPSDPRFAIVGVDDGRANTANPCLAAELGWAAAAPGQRRPAQPAVSLYLNTGNPGDGVADWPRSGTAPGYGACNGRLTDACSFLYGARRAAYSYGLVAALRPATARTAPWWLDVELLSSWAGTYELNIAALRGFVTGLRTAGATGPVGIYSTAAQWHDLTGLGAATTTAAIGTALPDWVAGTAATLADARADCAAGGFTGPAPTLAQYQRDGEDADLRCPATR